MGLSLAFIALVLWLMFRRRWLVSVIVLGVMVAWIIAASVWRSHNWRHGSEGPARSICLAGSLRVER